MRLFSILLIASMAAKGAAFFISPAFISDCTNGFAVATLTWSGASGPVQIHVGKSTGPAMTAFTDPSGSAVTGAWVTDGLTFYLVNQAGGVEGTVTAHVTCGGTPPVMNTGLAAGRIFPLAVGNTWVYKVNNRFVTATYVVWSITGTQTINGQTYFVLSQTSPASAALSGVVAWLRADNNGVIHQNTNGADQVYVDPNALTSTVYTGPLGTFNGAGTTTVFQGELLTTYTYVHGLGLVNLQQQIVAGSSGGFSESFDLIDVRVDGIHLSLPAPKIALSIEETNLDLTNKLAPDCPVPCYYAACGIGGGPVDPPTFYRPCAQIRIATEAGEPGYIVLTELLNPGSAVVFQSKLTVGTTSNNLVYLQVPLYSSSSANSEAITLLPPGDYTLLGTVLNGTATAATSSIVVHIH